MSAVIVIANHPDLAEQARPSLTPFIYISANKQIRAEAERRQLDLLRSNIDLVVSARYMRVLTGQFLDEVGCPVIDIHLSFLADVYLLPAFIGATPYPR